MSVYDFHLLDLDSSYTFVKNVPAGGPFTKLSVVQFCYNSEDIDKSFIYTLECNIVKNGHTVLMFTSPESHSLAGSSIFDIDPAKIITGQVTYTIQQYHPTVATPTNLDGLVGVMIKFTP